MNNLLLLSLIFFYSCNPQYKSSSSFHTHTQECAIAYDLNDGFFTDNDTLVFSVRFIYFMNGDTTLYTREQLEEKLVLTNSKFSSAKVKFILYNFENVFEKPSDKLKISTESAKKLTRYDISNFKFFALMLNEPHVINIYIYNEPDKTDFAGVAGNIISDYLAIRKDYFDAGTKTLEHELGHCLGLLHVHQFDETDGFNSVTGDKVCDTPSYFSLSGKVNKECDLIGRTEINQIDSIHIKNIMSYSYPFCRNEFTRGQIERMRWVIEQSDRMQNLLYNRHELRQKQISEVWLEIN
jgi:hypothetical protein